MADREGWWGRGLLAAAGLLGASGISLGAASVHLGGGDLVRLASEFLLFHAAAVPGVLSSGRMGARPVKIAATSLAVGAALFSGDVATLGLSGRAPFPGMAPAGGILMIVGWLLVSACAFLGPQGGDPNG